MAGGRVRLDVRERERRGSPDARRLPRAGVVPRGLYGNGKKPHAICVAERDLRRALTTSGGLNAIIDVVLDGQTTTHASILKDYQQDPLRGTLSHVDFLEVRLDQPIHATVPVQLIGEPAGAKEGGVLSQVTREINVEALPMEIPEHLELEVSEMAIGDTLRLADLPAREGVTFLDDSEETVLATVTLPTREVEPEEVVEEGEELPEGEVPPEERPEGAADEAEEPTADAAGEQGTTEG